MLIIVFTLIILLVIIVLFSFPQFSPIPYFPSNKKDLKYIIKGLSLKNNQAIFDLGAGDGLVIFEAAKEALKRKLNTKFIAAEINPVLIGILYIRKLFHPNRKNIQIMYGNMFRMDFKKGYKLHVTRYTFYLYISPWHLEKVIKNLKLNIKNFNVVSYMYKIKILKLAKKIKGKQHSIFVYNV